MKSIWVQFNKYEENKHYTLNAISNKKIEKAIWIRFTQEEINEIQEMLNEVNKKGAKQ